MQCGLTLAQMVVLAARGDGASHGRAMHVMDWVAVRCGWRVSMAEVHSNGDGGVAQLQERARAR